LADYGAWIGIAGIYNLLRIRGLLTMKIFFILIVNIFIGLVIITLGESGDTIQLGTSIPFGMTLICNFIGIYRQLAVCRELKTKHSYFELSAVLLLLGACSNEIFVVTGIIQTTSAFSLGALGSLLFFALTINEQVMQAYTERDHLRKHLEDEVEKKTLELRSAQGELVQSAKLASLGTLAAGIAHEINNSLNYVNGSLKPLERLGSEIPDEAKRKKFQTLIHVMNDGLKLTLEIIKSLRNYTGLNQAEFQDVQLKQVAQSVLTILKSKIRESIEVKNLISETAQIHGSVVGINQVLMNLIGNAIDAIKESGSLTLSSDEDEKSVRIMIRDTGAGIPPEYLDRIFEPFFTTKSVGSGTGLGLHIVHKEMERHGGKVQVESTVGVGTCFTLHFPKGLTVEKFGPTVVTREAA
jgi:signal transduction histidine kinase